MNGRVDGKVPGTYAASPDSNYEYEYRDFVRSESGD